MERIQIISDGNPSYSSNGNISTVKAYGNGDTAGNGYGNEYGLPVGCGEDGHGYDYHSDATEVQPNQQIPA